MKINGIELQEWHSFAHAKVDLSRVTVASVIGRNALAPERSNGCGKSYLLESVLYALYGYDRDPSSIQRLKATESTFVEINFEHRGRSARVKRGFKFRTDGKPGDGFLEFEIDGQSQGDKIKEIEPEIIKFVGCDVDLYMSTCFFTQGEADQFVRATAAKRKEILFDLLGLDVYEAHRKIASDEESVFRGEISALNKQRDLEVFGYEAAEKVIALHNGKDFPALIARTEATIAGLLALQGDFEISRAGMQSFVSSLNPLKQAITDAGAREKAARDSSAAAHASAVSAVTNKNTRRAVLTAEYRTRQEQIQQIPRLEAELVAAQTALAEAEAAVARYGSQEETKAAWETYERAGMTDKAAADSRIANASASLTRVRTLGPVCVKCEQSISVEHKAAHEMQFQTALDTATRESGAAAERIAKARESLDSIKKIEQYRQTAAVTLAGARPKAAGAEKTLADARKVASNDAAIVESSKTEMASLSAQIENANAAAESALAEHGRATEALEAARVALEIAESALDPDAPAALMRLHAAVVQRTKGEREELEGIRVDQRADTEAKDRLKRHEDRIHELDGQIAEKKFEADVRAYLVSAFSKNGIPMLVMENVVSEIERGTVDILATMDSPNRIHFRTETASGRDTILIDMETPDGKRGLKSFSGGQVTEVNLAIRLALSEVLSRRADVGFDSVFLDEVMAPLDSPARQCFLRVVQLMRRSFKQVFVISHHDEIKNMLESCVTVTWSPQGSTVEVAA